MQEKNHNIIIQYYPKVNLIFRYNLSAAGVSK